MPLKIKSQLSNESINRQLQDTPLRNNLSRMSQTASGLKNLSQERDLKKIEKQRDSSTDKSITNNTHRFSPWFNLKFDVSLITIWAYA